MLGFSGCGIRCPPLPDLLNSASARAVVMRSANYTRHDEGEPKPAFGAGKVILHFDWIIPGR